MMKLSHWSTLIILLNVGDIAFLNVEGIGLLNVEALLLLDVEIIGQYNIFNIEQINMFNTMQYLGNIIGKAIGLQRGSFPSQCRYISCAIKFCRSLSSLQDVAVQKFLKLV